MQQYFLKIPLESLHSCPCNNIPKCGWEYYCSNIYPNIFLIIIGNKVPPSIFFFFPSLNCLLLSPFSESPIVFSYNYHVKKKKKFPTSLHFYTRYCPMMDFLQGQLNNYSCVEWGPCLGGSIPPICAPSSPAACPMQSLLPPNFPHANKSQMKPDLGTFHPLVSLGRNSSSAGTALRDIHANPWIIPCRIIPKHSTFQPKNQTFMETTDLAQNHDSTTKMS